jgi:hypothetical protein
MTLPAEMLAWLGEPEGQDRPIYDGTVASLIGCYQTDKKSPYHGLALNTQSPACARNPPLSRLTIRIVWRRSHSARSTVEGETARSGHICRTRC